MKLLLDTNAVIWHLLGDRRLGRRALDAIEDPFQRKYVSAVSVWEMSVKRALGRLPAVGDLLRRLTAAGFIELPISFRHGHHAGSLPFHHRDPFDRMLVAQAQLEGLTIITADREIAAYDVPVLPATD